MLDYLGGPSGNTFGGYHCPRKPSPWDQGCASFRELRKAEVQLRRRPLAEVQLPKALRVYFGPNLAGPLYAGITEQDRVKRVMDTLENEGFGLADEAITPIPSYDLHGFGFSQERYWRGPVWINIDWFLMHGLEAYGYQDHARRLRKTIIELCKNEGFYEYFDPLTGRGLGSNLFSWSAALLLEDGE